MKHCLKFSILFISFFIVSASLAQSCPQPLKVGVIVPLTGGPTASGEAVKNSIILADKKFDHQNCVQFIFEDDQFQPKNSVSAAKKLIEVDHVDALLVFGTPTALAAAPLAERATIPMIGFSIHEKLVENKMFVMKHWCTSDTLNEAIVKEVKQRGYRNIGIVATVNDATLNLRDKFLKSGVAGVTVNEEINNDEIDFRSIVTKLIAAKVDAVYVLVFPQPGQFIRKLREGGYRGDMFSYSVVQDFDQLRASNETMVGAWYADADDHAGENYVMAYNESYGKSPVLGGANGYDVAKMLIDYNPDHRDLNNYLHHISNFSGAFGHYSATSNNDFDIPAVIKVVEKDGFRRLR